MTDYLKKALAEWSWADIEMLVENEVEEDTTFELKEDLSSDGNDPWQASQKKISGQARDSLAKEIVAFANAYGGTIALGIVESKDQPPRATSFKLIKKCVECAERLEQAIRQIVDPPLSGFEVKGIKKPNSEGDGAVILRVASSLSAPHGHGRPPQAYVRRSNKSEPLTMRDLHDRFWEARSRRERVEKILEERKAILLGFLGKRASGHLINDRMGRLKFEVQHGLI